MPQYGCDPRTCGRGRRFLPLDPSEEHHFGFQRAWSTWVVQAFFILSGLRLITGILLRCQQTDDKWFVLKAFYIQKNAAEIFLALYYLVIIGICLFQEISDKREALFWQCPRMLSEYPKVFSGNKASGSRFYITHFWSLAVEEQFYLFWPLIILFSPQRSPSESHPACHRYRFHSKMSRRSTFLY